MSIADELITRGWTQGTSENGRGEVCLVGAAAAALGSLSDDYLQCWCSLPDDAVTALYGALPLDWWDETANREARTQRLAFAVHRFNDTHTFDEVLRVAKEADAILDADA